MKILYANLDREMFHILDEHYSFDPEHHFYLHDKKVVERRIKEISI